MPEIIKQFGKYIRAQLHCGLIFTQTREFDRHNPTNVSSFYCFIFCFKSVFRNPTIGAKIGQIPCNAVLYCLQASHQILIKKSVKINKCQFSHLPGYIYYNIVLHQLYAYPGKADLL